ncbi:DNA cross-link repair protein pso2/snm1 [Chiua virens]|nr:DNA cross-link repair protein pso2/snm1 [Chiua virens]
MKMMMRNARMGRKRYRTAPAILSRPPRPLRAKVETADTSQEHYGDSGYIIITILLDPITSYQVYHMPPSRKRKEPPNRTLLDFFSSSEATKRANPIQSAPSVRERTASTGIIVIDSDSDDGVYGKENGKSAAQSNTRTGVPQGRQLSLGSVAAQVEDQVTFGMPSELLRSSNPHVEALSTGGSHAHLKSPTFPKSESMFGVSAPLLDPNSFGSQHHHETNQSNLNVNVQENMCIITGDNPTNDPAFDFPIGEWAAEDDERVLLEASDNSTETHDGEEDRSDDQRCPMCGLDLTGFLVVELETHVNQCLDMSLQNENSDVQESNATSVQTCVKPENSHSSTLIKRQRDNLYNVLMNSHKENESWIEADASVDNFRLTRGNRRKAPFYKVLQGMPIAVDAFCYGSIPGVTAYFLSHAHSDHYTNLGSKWQNGPIYCSEETANLIIHMLAVDAKWVHPLPLDTPTLIANTGGVRVTLIEANHCPGSCLFFFEGQQTIDAGDSAFKSQFVGSSRIFQYLHCGDFRASPRHVLHPAIRGKHLDIIYLDSTYLDPKYTFSPQPLVISACAELARRLVMGGVEGNFDVNKSRSFTIDAWMRSSTAADEGQQMPPERILVIVGTYSIGKERIVKAIAQALGTKIYCDPRKTAILRCQADQELHALLTTDPAEANVHLLPLGTVTLDNLRSYLQRFKQTFSRVIGFRPTGWTYSPPTGSNSNTSIQSIVSHSQSRHFSYRDLQPTAKSSYNIQIFGVPYSEHSSFFELTCFALSCDWGRIIPTVNVGNPTSRAKMTKWLKRWELEKCNKLSVQPRTTDYW